MNPAEKSRPRVETSGNEATVYLYDAIDPWWGISAQEFVKELNNITADTIHLRINSPGGDVFDARAIKTALEQHKATVKVHVDGLAASAASFIMLAGDDIEIAQGGFVMIHKAWGIAFGNDDDMYATGDLLKKVDGQIVGDYERKTGKARDEIEQWMKDETWFTADEALEAGFVDSIFDASAAENKFDLSAFTRAPKALTERKPPEPSEQERAKSMRAAAEARLALYERT